MSETIIVDGIQHPLGTDGPDPSCARCGSSADWLICWDCGGDLYTHHDCGDDTCCCLHPEDNVLCDTCQGAGGSWHCMSSREWCEAHPLPGCEEIKSTAMNPQAWDDFS
jgi:hypothetical protein